MRPPPAGATPYAVVPRRDAWRPGDDLAALPWHGLPALDLLRAEDGGPPRWATRVQLAAGPTALFLRFDCADGDRWATLTGRDAALWEEEVVELFLAPGDADPRHYFEIEVNPVGAVFDAAVSSPDGERSTMRVAAAWNCPGLRWQTGEGATAEDWWAALAVPWTGLGVPDPPPRLWRANFYRIERPRDGPAEHSAWSPTWATPADFHRPARFGLLELG